MNVKNRKYIRNLGFKLLRASRRRNMIAVCAIILMTLLFTSLFTIVLSINSSYETNQFRQIGGYCHGTFKEVDDEKITAIAAHPKVKAVGERRVIGLCSDGVFAKIPAEVSFMDANCTAWSYAQPQAGHMPEKDREVAMDTTALQKLGITPELGAQVTLTYRVNDKAQSGLYQTDTFTLVGYWDYDNLMPIHYINISRSYAEEIEEKGIASGMEPFRTDLNVMMVSSVDIQGQMEQVDTDLGYTWDNMGEENNVRIGVNWGYTTSQIGSRIDPETILAMAAFILLVIFTGYLIIYNIFQISVSGDIRFYGLLKTVGTTPRQLRRLIRHQALLLCLIGIPAGLTLGYGVGAVLVPVILSGTTLGNGAETISVSPVIFVCSAVFALLTVLLSCSRPGRLAAKVSPVEATKYTDVVRTKKKKRAFRGAKVHQMAFANLGRNKGRTFLVVVSLALAVTLLNELYAFVSGFSMEKYVSNQICADFIVSSPDYFRINHVDEFISQEMIEEVRRNTQADLAGCAYQKLGGTQVWMQEEVLRRQYKKFYPDSMLEQMFSNIEQRDGLYLGNAVIEGLDDSLFEKLMVAEGDLSPMLAADSNAIAVAVRTDDYGNVVNMEDYPKIGDTLTISYVEEACYIDTRTGGPVTEDTPEAYLKWHVEKMHSVDYTVCALVAVPASMSYRSYIAGGYDLVLPIERLRSDSEQTCVPMLYLFDTPDDAAEASAEAYLADLTKGDLSPLMYESKATMREEFRQFQSMFTLVGGLLCVIIGIVGILNFFNAVMTGIISRRREFAVLQSVGMTNRQLRSMLVYEGLFYALGAVAAAFVFAVIIGPFAGRTMNDMFWFYEYHFSVMPVLVVVPVFVLLGWLIPAVLYGQTNRQSVVERLREE